MATHQRRSQTEWQSLIDDFESSGSSVTTFCLERGIGVASFYQWRKRFSASAASVSDDNRMPSFLDVSSLATEGINTRWLVELDLGNGLTLRLNRG